ncbi:MAG: aminoacyl-tRNA hydrolase [Planctomycetes bacterium]|nr:aminoacyl-tRNA hydrolase [Planctomycetota bacterium]
MKLIVGLGNPGRKYACSRHNVGYDVVQRIAHLFGQGAAREKFHGQIVEAVIGEHRVLLLTPLTYMNNSGLSVLEARDFFKIDHADVLIVCDDFNLPLAKLRIRASGSAGGQKGLQDILRRLGSEDVPRLRIGIGTPPAGWDPADFVLSKFDAFDVETIRGAIVMAADAAAHWVRAGIQSCMNQYNAAAASAD